MPDTKSGREQKGQNKETQLLESLYERELRSLDRDEDVADPEGGDSEGEFIADELPDD